MSEREQSFRNRRRQADWVVNAAAVLSVLAWVVAFLVLLILDIASDSVQMQGLQTWLAGGTAAGGTARTGWNIVLLRQVGLILLVVSFLCSVAAFIFNMMRMRRKTDKYRKSVIIMGLITLVSIVFYVMRFGDVIF